MIKDTTIKNVMTTHLITVKPDDPMSVVDHVFKLNNIHHLPVIDETNRLVGMVSSQDYNRILHTLTLFKSKKIEAVNQAFLRSLLVKEVMTKEVVSLQPEDSIFMAMDHFRDNLFHAIPIVDLSQKLKGILSTYDLLQYAFDKEE